MSEKNNHWKHNETLVYCLLCICMKLLRVQLDSFHLNWSFSLFGSVQLLDMYSSWLRLHPINKRVTMPHNKIPDWFKNHAPSIENLCCLWFNISIASHIYPLIWAQRDNATDLHRTTLWNQAICTKYAHFETSYKQLVSA